MINCITKLVVFLILLLSFNAGYAQAPAFDGLIVFSRTTTPKRTSDIFILDGKTGKESKLTSRGDNHSPKLSPDGRYILFQSHRPDTQNSEIYLVDVDGKNEKRLTFTHGGNSRRPHWGHSADEIYFEATIRANIREYKIDSNKHSFLLIHGDVDGSDFVQVLDVNANSRLQAKAVNHVEDNRRRYHTIPSPDGKYALRVYDSSYTVELFDNDKGTTKLLGKEHDSGPPAWSKDGKMIAFFSGTIDETRLWTYDLAKNKYEHYLVPANDRIGCNMPAWGKDLSFIAFNCGTPITKEEEDTIYIIDLESKKSSKVTTGAGPDWF